MLIKSDPVRGHYFLSFLTLFWAILTITSNYIILGHLDDYIENIGIKYGIIKSNI